MLLALRCMRAAPGRSQAAGSCFFHSAAAVTMPWGPRAGKSLLERRASTLGERLESLVGRNGLANVVVVPGILRFLRLLHLCQIHVVHHAAILATASVLGAHAVDP